MTSQVEIANTALERLGARPISSFSDGSKAARLASSAYDRVRLEVLRAHPWNCISARALLAESTEPPAFGYAHQYPLPADCERVLEVGDSDSTDFESRYSWVVEGRMILTDEGAPLPVRYLKDDTDPQKYDSTLVSAIAERLAFELCEPITQSNTKKQAHWDAYQALLRTAKSSDGQEQSTMQASEDQWILARQGGSWSDRY